MLRRRAPQVPAHYPLHKRRAEALRLARRWDAVGRLKLLTAATVPMRRRSPLTAVQKVEQWDRLIVNRHGPSGEEGRLSRSSQQLAPSWVLADLVIAPGEEARFYGTDLSEMFYSFEVSRTRTVLPWSARSNSPSARRPSRRSCGSTAL